MNKMFFTILAILLVLLSLGFRDCNETYCSFLLNLNKATLNWGVGARGTLVELRVEDCEYYPNDVTDQNLNDAKEFVGFALGKRSAEASVCVVGDSGTVLWTSDNGQTWEDRSIPSLTYNLYGLDFLDRGPDGLHVIVCGDSGTVYTSTDSSGNWTWVHIQTPTTEQLTSIGAIAPDRFIAVGRRGTAIRTTDGGQTWQDGDIRDTVAHFNRLYLGKEHGDPDLAWAVGDSGRIYFTYLAGLYWLRLLSGTTENLYDITFRNSREGIIAGANGVVRYSTNGGYDWLEDPYFSGLTTGDILSIAKVDSLKARALVRGGSSGGALSQGVQIMTVWSDPPTGVSEDRRLPSAYRLEQCYPNPFNPITTVEFELPRSEHVSLEIFSILGEKAATLVSGTVRAGVHNVQWNASEFPSGVYLCRLSTAAFAQTKKLLLLR